MLGLLRKRRRRRIVEKPFPREWLEIIERNCRFWRSLSNEDREELKRHVLVFLHEKRFEGCGGLTITDEIRVTIAAQACLLLLNRDTDYYPALTSILVYPRQYFANAKMPRPDGTVVEGMQMRLGESWHLGSIVLSWDDVRRGAADPCDGRNVVLHEFAHQLDGEYGPPNGAPALPEASMYGPWAETLGQEYQQLLDDLANRRQTLIDAYGATSPAEFFAVVTELFFERPAELLARHPDLYEQFRGFYRQHPAERAFDCGDGRADEGPFRLFNRSA